MRFLGIVIPAALLVAFVVLLLLGFGVVGQTLRGRPFMGTVGVVGLLVMAAALPGAISTHIGYAVPWRQTPYHVLFRGRDYYHEGCDTQARRPLRSVRVAWVYGYFVPWQPLYTAVQSAHRSYVPTLLWLDYGALCEPVYALSGGP